MTPEWRDTWTFRIVDPVTGAAVPGVAVTVYDEGGRSGGAWVSDVDGLVRIPKHDVPRLRLRVGLKTDDMIELNAAALPDEVIPLSAPPTSVAAPSRPASEAPRGARRQPGHVLRFARIGVLPQDADIASPATVSALPGALGEGPGRFRYGVLFEIDQVWESLGSQAGDLLYSVSLGPGEEVSVAVLDARWRKASDAGERPFQIVAKILAAPVVGDGLDAVPLEPLVVTDLAIAAGETVRHLTLRTVRVSDDLRRRPLGVTTLDSEDFKPPRASVRKLRNLRAEGVITYHVVEPVERFRVIVRTPALSPVVLVPFRLPNIAERDVVRRFGHALRRALLDRTFVPDIELLLTSDHPPAAVERRLFAHFASNLPYYSATIIAAGRPAERAAALAKLRDVAGRPVTDLIENRVVGRVGSYVAFPLRTLDAASPEWRLALAEDGTHRTPMFQEATVTLPLPGVWLRAQLSPAYVENDSAAAEEREAGEEEGGWGARRTRRRR